MEEIKKIVQKAGPLKIGIIIICGILLICISFGGSGIGVNTKTEEEEEKKVQEKEKTLTYREQMETELIELLQRVEGVGKVEVMLTLKADGEKVTLKDNVDNGESREEETVLIEDSERNSTPYVVQEMEPELEGVVVVCEGGDNILIKKEITEATQALFEIDSHKIKVMKSKEVME